MVMLILVTLLTIVFLIFCLLTGEPKILYLGSGLAFCLWLLISVLFLMGLLP